MNSNQLTQLRYGGYVIADPAKLTWTELTDTAGELLLRGAAEGCTAEEAADFLAEAATLGWTQHDKVQQ